MPCYTYRSASEIIYTISWLGSSTRYCAPSTHTHQPLPKPTSVISKTSRDYVIKIKTFTHIVLIVQSLVVFFNILPYKKSKYVTLTHYYTIYTNARMRAHEQACLCIQCIASQYSRHRAARTAKATQQSAYKHIHPVGALISKKIN